MALAGAVLNRESPSKGCLWQVPLVSPQPAISQTVPAGTT